MPVLDPFSRVKLRAAWFHRCGMVLPVFAALLGRVPDAMGDIESVVGKYNSVDILFKIAFTEASMPQNGWEFQVFLDSDNDLSTGYGAGFEQLVRGVEYATPDLIHFRTAASGSGPGGWGASITTLPIIWLDDRHVEIQVVLASAGLLTGNVRYTLELYENGRLVDDVRLARTVQGSQADCNHNGIGDAADIANCTGLPACADCNGNQIPDECDITGGISADCNQNGVPDDCDIASGTSTDCGVDGVPDECEDDCNGNGVGDSCDVFDGTSEDCDGNLIPDECAPVAAAVGGRWIAVHPPAGPRKVAIRITGQLTDPDVSCISRYVQVNGRLGVSPVYQFPDVWCTAYVHGMAIKPGSTYTVQLIDGVTFFPPRVVTTWNWGDVVHDGFLNVTDIQAILLYISGARLLDREAVDIGPCVPDGFVNVTDVQTAALAFTGLPYESSSCIQPCP